MALPLSICLPKRLRTIAIAIAGLSEILLAPFSVLSAAHAKAPAETASHEHAVTLWDELARPAPAPLPVPIDAADTAKSNAASYTYK